MGKKFMAGALLAVALTFGAPADARAGCVTDALRCAEWAWSLESYWDRVLALDACYKLFNRCLQEQLLGL
jgi:hypothetical protein